MNGRKAKLLRKIVYGDQSLRQERKYTMVNTFKRILTFKKEGKSSVECGTFVNSGLRGDYRSLKKMAGRWTMPQIKKAFADLKEL